MEKVYAIIKMEMRKVDYLKENENNGYLEINATKNKLRER